VAGATGAIGLATVRALVAHGHEVTGLSRTAVNRRLLEELGVEAVVADAMDADAMAAAVARVRPDVVVDLLAPVPRGGPWFAADMERTNQLRSQGSRNLLDAAEKAGARQYVAESSRLVYGSGDLGDEPLTEDSPAPARPPARVLADAVEALLAKERHVLEASTAGRIEGVVLRFGDSYGLGAGTEVLASQLLTGHMGVLKRQRGGTPWLHVDEAADAIVAAVERGRPGAVYNVAEDESISVSEFLRCLAQTVNAPAPPAAPDFAFAIATHFAAPYFRESLIKTNVRLSNQRARAELGWTPRFASPREGLVAVGAALAGASAVTPRRRAAGRPESEGSAESARTVLVALGTNVVMVIAKAFAAALTGSPALFAETLHSLADTSNELLLYLGLRRARRAADLRHPYGYGSEAFFWSLLAALGIFLSGGVLSIWEGIQQLLHPSVATNFIFGYAVIGLGFVIDGTSFLLSLRQLTREARARGVRLSQHVRGTTDTAVTAAYREDGAALLGGLLALAGLVAHQLTGSAIPDAFAAIAIGALLAGIGLGLVRRNRDLLTNLSESPKVLDRIRDLLLAEPEIARVGSVATLYVGPHQLLVTAEIQPVDDLSGLRLRELVEDLCGRVTDAIPRAVAVYLMPVVTAADPPAVTPFDPDYWLRRYPDPEQY
jgi:cation diffusion facilitator family transporter